VVEASGRRRSPATDQTPDAADNALRRGVSPRRGDLRSRLSREALTAGINSTPPPCWTGRGAFGRAKDRSLCYGAQIFGALRISFDWRAALIPFAVVEPIRHRNAPYSRTATCALALANAPANAQPGATPATPDNSAHPTTASRGTPAQPPTADDICRALEQSAAENAHPVEFFARVIWQESRFDARTVSPTGAEEAQVMPRTTSWHGLADPFDPIEALRHSAAYLRDARTRFQPGFRRSSA
jgi:soluble lytic murein transglycosylase-like protein